MKLLLVFGIFMSFCYFVLSATPFDESEYQAYMKKFDKKYTSTSVMDNHKNMYMKNKAMVENHNKRYENKQVTYRMCLNKFADMLPNEFPRHDRPITANENRPKRYIPLFKQPHMRKPDNRVPDSIDWRKRGAVTQVKNQGNCRSCWAHATTGVIEGQLFQKTRQLVPLSEQNLVDCSMNCSGGSAQEAYRDLNDTIGGLVTSELYPYVGENSTFVCRNRSSQSVVKVLGYRTIKKRDEIELKEAVATVGPIAIAFKTERNFKNQDFLNFRLYCEGIYSEPNCSDSDDDLNHEMLVVGYGVQNGADYWIVKNSFGDTWGENGYVRVKRGDNTCGIASDATFPIILPTDTLTSEIKPRGGPDSLLASTSTAATQPLRNTAFFLVLPLVNLFCLLMQ